MKNEFKMKNNTWKILAIIFFTLSLLEFLFGYSHILNIEKNHFDKIKEFQYQLKLNKDSFKLYKDSIKLEENMINKTRVFERY